MSSNPPEWDAQDIMLIPLTVGELRRRLQDLTSSLAPRVAVGTVPSGPLPELTPIEIGKFIRELMPQIGMN